MPARKRSSAGSAGVRSREALQPREAGMAAPASESLVHVYGSTKKAVVCDTDSRGHESPRGRGPLELVLNASEGFIPLWVPDTVLRWRFRDRSFEYFQDPAAAKAAVRDLMAQALMEWGDAAPVAFKHDDDLWDFEVVMRNGNECSPSGCVLASAFFPGAGREKLQLYPKLLEQSNREQVETLIHEFGHIFGLRHFFANVTERAWPAEIFGRHDKFSIMNYGENSRLTAADKEDLALLYRSVWSGDLAHVNGTPIRRVACYSSLATSYTVPTAVAFRTRQVERNRTRTPRTPRAAER